MIGRTVAALPSARIGAEINEAGAYSSVHLSSDFLPAHLTGTIHHTDGPHRRDLAVALNGRIVAVGQSFTLAGNDTENFSILIPEGAFGEGANRVELLSVAEEGGALRLASIARA